VQNRGESSKDDSGSLNKQKETHGKEGERTGRCAGAIR